MKKIVKQVLENLPQEILSQSRFFQVGADKVPYTEDWSNPDNQKLHTEINGYKGFDTAGHGIAPDYLFLDFDNCLDANGNFVTPLAEQWFNLIRAALKSYCELSASKTGAHIIALPTAGKFKKISSGKKGRIYFSERRDKDAPFLEVFYLTGGRYCFFTGDVWHCEPNTPITHGQAADDVFQLILDEITKNNTKPNSEPCAEKQKNSNNAATLVYQSNGNSREFDTWRACKMLEIIPVALLSREDWVNVGMALKNNGNSVSDWEQWSRPDDRFKDGECETLWQGFNGNGLTIGTIADIANQYGYDAKAVWKEWCNLHPEFKNQIIHKPEPISDDEAKDDFIRTQDKIKSCPVNLRLATDYDFSTVGISLVVETKKGVKYIPVTKTPIIPTKIYREPQKSKYTYEIAILIRGVWRTVEIDGRTLADPRAILTLADTGALILEPKILCRFLNEIISLNYDLQEIKAYVSTGWTEDDFKTFAYPGNGDCIVRRTGFDFNGTLARRGDPKLWKQKFIEVDKRGGAIVHAYIGIGLSAILARPLNLMNPQAHLFGTSGGAKTTLLKFIASTFGNPRELMKSFAATNKYRQLVAAAFCDLPSFFDELETLKDKKAEENLPSDVYNFADGKGNQANKKDGTARETFRFGGARLTTGERPMLKQYDMRGAYKRLLQFKISDKIFDDEFATDLFIFSELNFGHYGLQWIQYVQSHMAEIQTKYQHFAKKDPTTQNYEPLQLTMLAAGLVAYEFFKVAIGVTAEFDGAELIRDRRYLIDYQLPTLAQLDDTARALEALKSFVAAHERYFLQDVTNSETGEQSTFTFTNETYGKIFDDGAVAFYPTALTKILEKELGFASADKLIAEWSENGTLKTNNGRNTLVVRIGKKTYKTYYFNAGKASNSNDSAEISYYEKLDVGD